MYVLTAGFRVDYLDHRHIPVSGRCLFILAIPPTRPSVGDWFVRALY